MLGTLTLDREMSFFLGTCRWMEKQVQILLDVDMENKASWTRVRNVMKQLVADQESWDKSLRAMAAQKLTTLSNEWLADNDQIDRDPKKKTPLLRRSSPDVSSSPSFPFLPAAVLPPGMRTMICSGAM